jgi:hypothetical protein
MAKNGVSCTRKRKLFSVTGVTSQAVLARAVAAPRRSVDQGDFPENAGRREGLDDLARPARLRAEMAMVEEP